VIRAYWNELSPRDRRVLAIGAVVVAALLGWAFVWHPLDRKRSELEQRVALERQSLAFVRGAAATLAGERPGAGAGAARAGRSLLALADASARDAGLEAALRRVEPVNARSVRVTLELASFDAMVLWIENLARDYAVRVSDLSADRADAVGLVNARVTLEDAP
jgi:general secretion pathway protein M